MENQKDGSNRRAVVDNLLYSDVQDLVLKPMVLTIRDLVSLKNAKQIRVPKAYQRRYNAWALDRFSSFVIGNWRGFSAKDSFLLVDVQACYDNELTRDNPNQDFVDHLKGHLDDGVRMLIVDGQHRIESNTAYINGKEVKFNKGVDRVLILGENKYHLNMKYNDFPEAVKNFYLNQQVVVSMIVKGSLPSLKKLFVTSNDGTPLSEIEKAMAGNAPNAVDGVLDIVGIQHYSEFFSRIAKVNLTKKQDAELVAKFLMFEHDRETTDLLPKKIPFVFHPDLDGYVSTTKADIKRLRSNVSTLVDSLNKALPTKGKVPMGKIINSYMLGSLITDSRSHHLVDKILGTNVRVKIENPQAFGDWFLKTESDRMNDKWLMEDYEDDNGETKSRFVIVQAMNKKGVLVDKRVENTTGYAYATNRESNGQYIVRRQSDMLEDFKSYLESSESIGIVKKIDTTKITKSTREKVVTDSNFMSSIGEELTYREAMNGDKFHIDHIQAKDLGGKGDISNYQLMDSKSNIVKSNKEM